MLELIYSVIGELFAVLLPIFNLLCFVLPFFVWKRIKAGDEKGRNIYIFLWIGIVLVSLVMDCFLLAALRQMGRND